MSHCLKGCFLMMSEVPTTTGGALVLETCSLPPSPLVRVVSTEQRIMTWPPMKQLVNV
jgi:hypothetical protein